MSPIYINNNRIESIYSNNQSIGKVYVGDVLVFQKNNYTGDPFKFTINTTLGTGDSFNLPLRSGYNYDFVVDWGDGNTNTITSYNQTEKLHTYSDSGIYTISISGLCESWYFNYAGDRLKLTSIDQWGDTGFVDMMNAFMGCNNLFSVNDTDGTWCSNVTNMGSMFTSCSLLTTLYVNNWNVSNVTYMQSMFNSCAALTTLDVSNWDVSNVTNMGYMFNYCTSLTTLYVNNWNVSNVTDMQQMFNCCAELTTLDVSNWNVSNVTSMRNMFTSCSLLTTLYVNNWNVFNVTNMNSMFAYCSSLTTLDVSNWDVSNVNNMSGMFRGCTLLETLDVSNWNVSNVTNMQSMFFNTPLDTASYDALLIGWSQLPSLQSNVQLNANLTKYSSGAATTARGILTSAPNYWKIYDAGQL